MTAAIGICPRGYFLRDHRIVGKLSSLAFLVSLLAAQSPSAFAGLELALETHLESLSGSGWRAHQIDVTLKRRFGDEGSLHVTIQQLEFSEPMPPLQGIDLHCPHFSLTAARVQCSQGQLRIGSLQGQSAHGQVNFTYQSASRILEFDIVDLALARGRLTVQGQFGADSWIVNLDAAALNAAALSNLLQTQFAWPLDEQGNQGRLTLKASLSGRGSQLSKVRFQVASQGLSFSAAAGRYAAQELAARLEGHWGAQPQGELFTARLQLDTGQLYLDPVFLDLTASSKPVIVSVAGQRQGKSLDIERVSLQHDQVLQVHGSLALGLDPVITLKRADITFAEAFFPQAYSHYLQPFLIGTALGDMRTEGRLSGRLVFDQKTVQVVELSPMELSLDDTKGRFGAKGLNGQLAWMQDSTIRRSDLSWEGGHLYQLDIDAGKLAFQSTGDEFYLLGQTRIPVLDGAVIIDRLEGQGLGTSDVSWQFEGSLTPISMESISQALGWPTLSGKLSGVVPSVRYADRTLEIRGALRVRVFEGEVVITNLRMERPFGVVPKVFADLQINHLDLRVLTRTFDFGRITGKLEGRVKDLRLENWEPVHFEAWFASPKEQYTQRRISQRAVQNLSALGGGGAGAVLSRGFLSLFEEFNYERLGIRCRLVNNICEMGGIAPVDSGYYLVQGQGLPRLDVIGYNRLVDWSVLLDRLEAAIQSEGPVVR